MLAVVLFLVDALYQVEDVPFCSLFAESFYKEWMLNSVSAFYARMIRGLQERERDFMEPKGKGFVMIFMLAS